MRQLTKYLRVSALVCAAAALLWSQAWPGTEREPRLPNGRSQREAMLKAEYQKTLKDAGRLVELAEDLKAELEKNERHVLSLSSIKKAEEIEKLAERIRKRLKRN